MRRFQEVTKEEASVMAEEDVLDLEKLQEAKETASQDKADLFDFYNEHWDKLVEELKTARLKLASRRN